VAEAKKLMVAAGYPDGIDIDCTNHTGPNYGATYAEHAQLFVDQMQKSGLFRVNHRQIPYAEWLPTIFQTRDYKGLALTHPGFGGNLDSDSSIWSSYHTASGQQFRGIKDTVLEAMIDKQRTEFDADKRAGLMFEIQKYLAQKMYLIPTEGVADQFYFRWPWVRNEGWPEWNQWLANDMPKRNG
jgi:ABC-type transport system substrate-binding protein